MQAPAIEILTDALKRLHRILADDEADASCPAQRRPRKNARTSLTNRSGALWAAK
jgi:hypothetical protein